MNARKKEASKVCPRACEGGLSTERISQSKRKKMELISGRKRGAIAKLPGERTF